MRSPIHDIIVHGWVVVCKRERLCTCHKLFHNYLVILNHACVREREPRSTNNRNNILSNILKTNMLNIKNIKTASSYSDTAVIGYIAIRTARPNDRFASEVKVKIKVVCVGHKTNMLKIKVFSGKFIFLE